MNYYSYFSEIEEHFVRRRKKHLYVSPLDWALIQTWKEMNIPLPVVLRGIDSSFDQHDAKAARKRIVNTLFFCQQAVEECFAEYTNSRVGQAEESPDVHALVENSEVEALLERFSGELSLAHQRAFDLGMEELAEVFERALVRISDVRESIPETGRPNPEIVEKDLLILEEMICGGIMQAVGKEVVESWQKEGKQELRPYKKRVPVEMYEKIMVNYLRKKARQHFGLSQFSLFAL
jgi:hypothetical protein